MHLAHAVACALPWRVMQGHIVLNAFATRAEAEAYMNDILACEMACH